MREGPGRKLDLACGARTNRRPVSKGPAYDEGDITRPITRGAQERGELGRREPITLLVADDHHRPIGQALEQALPFLLPCLFRRDTATARLADLRDLERPIPSRPGLIFGNGRRKVPIARFSYGGEYKSHA